MNLPAKPQYRPRNRNSSAMKRRFVPAISRCLASVFLLVFCLSAEVRAEGELKIVVLVNDEPISAYDIVQRVRFISSTTRQKPTEQLRKQVIEDLIDERIQLQEAKKLTIAISEKEIDTSIGRVAKTSNMSAKQMQEALKQLGVNPSTFRARIKAMMAWRTVIRRKFRRQIVVSSAEVDKMMKSEESSPNAKKTELQMQRIDLQLPQKATQRAVADRFIEAENLRKKFNGCQNISKLAASVQNASVSPMERKTTDQISQPSRALLLKAKVGQMTPARLASKTIELYAVCDRGTAVEDKEKKRQAIEAKLRQQEFNTFANRYLRDLRQESYIEYR